MVGCFTPSYSLAITPVWIKIIMNWYVTANKGGGAACGHTPARVDVWGRILTIFLDYNLIWCMYIGPILHSPPFALFSVIKSDSKLRVRTAGMGGSGSGPGGLAGGGELDEVDHSWLFLRKKRAASHRDLLRPVWVGKTFERLCGDDDGGGWSAASGVSGSGGGNEREMHERRISDDGGSGHESEGGDDAGEEADGGGVAKSGYDPYFLDNPSLRSGTERVLYQLPGLMISVVPYVAPKEVKRQLNEQFRQRHEELHPSLTLGRIRGLKRTMLGVASEVGLDLSTVALAYVYFEKLIIAGKAVGATLKLLGAACLLLAEKFNGRKAGEYNALLDALSRAFSVSMRYVVRTEFRVMIQLEFALHVQVQEALPHLTRLCSDLKKDISEFGPFSPFQLAYLRAFYSSVPVELAQHQLDEELDAWSDSDSTGGGGGEM